MEASQQQGSFPQQVLIRTDDEHSDGRPAADPVPDDPKESLARAGGSLEDQTAQPRGEGQNGQARERNLPPR